MNEKNENQTDFHSSTKRSSDNSYLRIGTYKTSLSHKIIRKSSLSISKLVDSLKMFYLLQLCVSILIGRKCFYSFTNLIIRNNDETFPEISSGE